MDKSVLMAITGLIAVMISVVSVGFCVTDDDYSSSGETVTDDVQKVFDGSLTIGGVTKKYTSFDVAIEDANNADKTIVFASDSSFNKIGTYLYDGGTADYGWYDVSGLTIDLAGHNVEVQRKMALIFGGSDFIVRNGSFNTVASYALFIGDGEDIRNNILLENLTMNGGVNIFIAQNVVLKNLDIDVTSTVAPYYAVWCDYYADAVIEGGSYRTVGDVSVFRGSPPYDDGQNKLPAATMEIKSGSFEIASNQVLVAVTSDCPMEPVITGGFFYGDGADSAEISKYVPNGYRVIESTYGGIQGFEVVPVGTLVTVTIDVQGDGSVDSMGLKVLEGTEISVEDNVLTVGDRIITATASSGYTFAGWLSVPSGTVTSDVTITALFMKADSDDDVEVDTDSAKIIVEKTQGTTSIVSEIKTDEVEDVDVAISETLDKIAEVQKISGSSSQTVAVQVVVPVSGEEGTLEISSTTVTKLMDTGAELTVNNGGTTVSLETKVIETLANESAKQPGDTLSIVVTPDTKKLNDKQKTVVGQNQAVDVSAYLGEKKISDLGGTAKISVPYQTNNKVKVTYVMDDGTTENVDCIYADGVVSFITTHFSVYMISEVKSPSFIIIPDTSDDDFPGYVPTPSSDTTDSGSKDTARIAVLLGAIVVLLVAMVALTHKSR